MVSDTIQYWLDAASRYPLLTARQEIELSRQVREWLDYEEGGPDAAPPQVQRRGKRARERFIVSNLKLVVRCSKRYGARIKGTSLGQEDLLQEGVVGLSRAAEKYDSATGYKFSTYAFFWIQQAMQRLCEQQCSTIRLPGGPSKLLNHWTYRPQGQTLEEFAVQEKIPVERARETLGKAVASRSIVSLDKRCRESDDRSSSFVEVIAADQTDPLDEMDNQLAIEALEQQYPDDLAILQLFEVEGARLTDIALLNGHKSYQKARKQVEQARARLELVAASHYGKLSA